MPKFDSDTAWQFKEAVKESPDRPRNIWLVFAMSLGSGATVMIGSLLIIAGIDGDGHHALVAGGLATLFVWAWWLFKADALVFTFEKITGHDLNRDGSIGEPQAQNQKTYIELPLSATQRLIIELDASWELVQDWCITAANGGSLSYASWEPRFALPDGTEGRERYSQYRQQLVSRGLAREKGNAGLKFTRNGWLFVEAMTELDAGTPTALLDAGSSE